MSTNFENLQCGDGNHVFPYVEQNTKLGGKFITVSCICGETSDEFYTVTGLLC